MNQFEENYSAPVMADLAASRSSAEEGQLTVDVYQAGNEIVVQSAIAGVNSDEIDISISKDMVTIKGRRTPPEKIKANDYFHQELFWGQFSRSVILPADVDMDKARALIKNGVLTIRLPKLKP